MKNSDLIMRRFALFYFAVLCSIIMVAQKPYDTEIDGICYKIVGDEAVVTVYSENEEWNSDHYAGVIVIPEEITYKMKKYPVTAIGPKTFKLCHQVTEVYLPDALTTISDEAFEYDNVSLQKVHIGPNVNVIGKDAFNSTNLIELDLDPANRWFVFDNKVLYSADHKRAITCVPEPYSWMTGKNDNLVLHDDVEVIDNGFACGRRLNSVRFGNAIKSIGNEAFRYAFSETEDQHDLILPDGIEHIGKYAFAMCIRVNNLHLPDSLTRLEEGSFSYVSPEFIHMPKNLKVICDRALYCSSGSAYTNLVLPEGLDSIGQYGITSINCDSLIIPSTVRYLSNYCLDNFSRYIEIKAPLDCIATAAIPSQGVKELILPKSLKRIEKAAFYPCYGLERIVWPDALEYIGAYAFAGVRAIPLVVPSTVKTLGGGAFADNVWRPRTYYFTSPTPPECLQEDVFEGIYYEESKLFVPRGSKSAYEDKAPWSWFGVIEEFDEIVLPPEPTRYDFAVDGIYYNVVSVDEHTCEVSFDLNYITEKNMYNYKSVTIPETVTYDSKVYTVTGIEGGAFSETPLEHIDLPKTLTYIDGAFSYCENLSNIEIPESVTSIGGAFAGCDKIKSIHLPDGMENIASAFMDCRNLESVNIPSSVTLVDGAFNGCSSLKSVEFPDDITEIGQFTCFGCKSLASVKLPSQLQLIGENAFAGCESLKSIVLPSKLYIIKTAAFSGCDMLKDVISLNPEPPYPVGYSQFSVYDGTLHVPAGSKSAYESINMWRYFNIIEDAETSIALPTVLPFAGKSYDILGRPVSDNYKGLIIKDRKLMYKTRWRN